MMPIDYSLHYSLPPVYAQEAVNAPLERWLRIGRRPKYLNEKLREQLDALERRWSPYYGGS